jgi:RNA polymerase sigma factor (sigma-70 family)
MFANVGAIESNRYLLGVFQRFMLSEIAVPSNADLLHRCQAGDGAAWQVLVVRYARLVHSVPIRYGMSQSEAEDVAQETFWALAQQVARIEEPDRLSGWLLTTARRISWRALQQRRQEQPDAVADLTEHENVEGKLIGHSQLPTYAELVASWDRQEALQIGMARINPRCRELLTLIFLDADEPSYAEISARLGMPTGSIGPTRNRCLVQLREILKGLGFGDVE